MSGDGIAIIGLALRFPGAQTLVELYDHLAAGRSLITEVPAERWSRERYLGDPRGGEKTASVWAGFVADADRFDAAFFAISPREAETMDPQQRFALELAWKAVEDAGYPAGALAGSRTGVFLGLCHADYAELIERDDVPTDAYFPTGTSYSIAANRVSYFFDFHGPSIVNDTACSSSLVSIYEAVSALRNGDCDLALAGGVNLCWSPKLFVAFSKAGMLSPTGRTHAFDQAADGFVRGEGGAVLVLKPLAAAVADGDNVHAVIKGVGTNHGGRTNSLTVTNPAAQAALIRDVYTRAGVAPETVGYIEAHGPGTPVGDPIEVLGLKHAFRDLHEANGTTPTPGTTGIGSIKTNIGHLESAAGVAGVVKVVAAMTAGVLPATAGFRQRNRLIDLDGSPFYIVGDTQPWASAPGVPRRAGVSSFGFGGTNAHVLLEEHLGDAPDVVVPGPHVVPLSARDPERLRELAGLLRDHVAAPEHVLVPHRSPADVAHTFQTGREALAARAVLVVADRDQLVDALGSVAEGEVRNPAGAGPDVLAAAEAWVRGGSVDWGGSRGARRVRLPTYPFARDRHWYRTPRAGAPAAARPLIRRDPAGGPGGTAEFDGAEPFLASHRVRGRRVLPAVVYLELARAAAAAGTSRDGVVRLRDVAWTRPLVVDEPVTVHIGFEDGGDSFGFRCGGTVHATGRAEVVALPEPSPLDLDALRASCPEPRDVDGMYESFRAQGLEYGPDMRALREVWTGRDEAFARVEVAGTDGHVLPPNVLDAAFQLSAALTGATSGPVLPFALAELCAYRACPAETRVWVRRRPGALAVFDVDVCDREGVITASLRGLVQRTAAAERPVVTATTQWVDRPLNPGGTRTAHSITPSRIAPADPADGIDAVTDQAFAEVRRLLADRPEGEHRFVVPVDDRVPAHFHAPLVGLFRTVALENPLVSGRVVRVGGLDSAPPGQVARIVADECADDSPDSEVRYRADGTRQVLVPAGISLAPAAPRPRPGAVYWVTGGLGGIGHHLARHLGGSGATLVLSGRAEHGPVDALRAAGLDAHYLAVDVTDAAAVRAAVARIVRDHGSLDGIVHAAGVLRDQYLLRKDLADVRIVTAPKIRGALHLDAATRHLDLDFFVLFSSVAGVYGNPGQSDYAAANAFLDAFARHRRSLVDAGERSGTTVSVSWPLWADGGMTSDEVTRESMRRERGWEALPTEAGLWVFDRCLAADAPAHVLVAFGGEASLDVRRGPVAVPDATGGPVGGGDLLERTEDLLRGVVAEALRHEPATIGPTTNLVEYGIDSLSILDITAKLEQRFGPLSKTIFFEYLNLADVAAHFVATRREQLVALLGESSPPPAPAPVAETEPVAPVTGPAPATAVVRERDRGDRHDIAIIGVSGRYPGADTMDELWDLLEQGRHAFEEVPAERWDHGAAYDSDRSVPGKTVIRTGTFLRDIDKFDPRYFRVSKREAEQLSPEVRLFLQIGVQALEDAGYSRETIQRRYQGDVGVLVGTMSNHYNLYGFQNSLTRGSPQTGSYTGTIPNMLSYFYGLTGPSIFVDTMCSASSTCVHQAVQMLRAGECAMVVAGGVNLLLHPYNLITSSQEHFTTGTSDVIRSFGRGVDGTILGEGVGAVVLKPLVDAERDGDHVYAVIKGTALANAGVRNGFTVPNPVMQARAIEKAIDDAGVDPRTIGYVEGHGSGTALGDPVEVHALTSAYRRYTSDTGFCALGSVKANLGHLLAAAGMIGTARVLLQLRHRKLVPSLHSAEPNPDIDFAATPFRVQQALSDWHPVVTEVDGGPVTHPRRAGITSIGAGGMNSHIVVEEHPGHPRRREPFGEQVFVFSAMNEAALGRYLTSFRDFLAGAEEGDLPDIAFTLRVGKNELPHRWAFTAADKRTALAAVDGYLKGGRELPADEPAATWVGGGSVDWDLLPSARRVSLPAYPFEKVRCWVEPTGGAPSVLAPLALRERLHPFLGRNESDVRGLRYGTDVDLGDLLDYTYRRDKAVAVVPTFVADLALATAKVSGFAAEASVHDLRVLRPVDWSATGRLVTEFADGRGTVRTEAGPAAEFAVRAATAPSGRFDPTGLRQVLTGERFLAELAEGGLVYRPESGAVDGVFRTSDGHTVLSLGRPRFEQDHVRRNTTVEPAVLAAIAQGVQWEARRAGEPDWPGFALNRVDRIHVRAGAPVERVVFEDDRVLLVGDGGAVVGELTGLGRGVGGTAPAGRAAARPGPPRADSSVVDGLRSIAAGILKFAPDELDPATGLDAFGFDSISLVRFAEEIDERFGVKISPAVFFDVSTLAALGAYVADRLGAESGTLAVDAVEPAPPRPGAVVGAGGPRADADLRPPIAVVGAAGRFPGAGNPAEFWANLVAGRDSVGEFPMDRYAGEHRRRVEAQDFPKRMGALDDVDAFDAAFFGLLPREVELMDPQHRLVLETVWQALEDSAYRPADLPSNTGVFIGVTGNDYATGLTALGVPPDAFTSTGTTHSILANRVSYLLDVRGPSEPVDTACSSSLVAVHRAIEAIRSGACDMALAGGVNVLLAADTFVSAHRAGMLSPDGLCRTFDARANGYVRGEGVGVVVLKPLSAAERDGDAILGVLRGSACNHGGRANSLTAPNADAQAELVVAAVGDLDPDTIGYVEAHGTGTALGDPVEVRALRTALRRLGRRDDGGCGIGSVKTNIGHLESAAGIAGLMKVLLALEHGVLPASLHVGEVNPYLELDGGPLRIVRENEPWPRSRDGAPRRAGVSSFGFGGVNAHVVVEEYRGGEEVGEEAGPFAVPLSARNARQLTERARDLLAHLAGAGEVSLGSVAWSLQVGREEMAERVGWVVSSRAELVERLTAFVADGERGSAEGPIARWVRGDSVDWRSLHDGPPPRRVRLPGYPFARDRFWFPVVGKRTGTVLLTPEWTAQEATGDAGYDRRVVVLCGIDADVPGAVRITTDKRRPESRFRDLSWRLLETVRDLDVRRGRTLVQVVTDGVAPTGLLRSVGRENPGIVGQVIVADGAEAAAVLAENAPSGDDLVVYRGGVRHTRGWTAVAPEAGDPPWRAGGVYLITGGTGGLGALTARRIAADTHRASLVLVGRSPVDDRVEALLADLRRAGADARYARADVSRWEEVRHLVAEAGEITGIVHAAGVLRDGPYGDKNAEGWADVLGAKVDGLVHLDRATEHCPLEFVLAFSSGAGITGNPGQADYAVANAFLDQFAAERNSQVAEGRRRGRTLSVAWPLWADGGMRVGDDARAYLWRDRGLSPMPTEDGFTALVDAWNTGADVVWVHHGDPERAGTTAAPPGAATDPAPPLPVVPEQATPGPAKPEPARVVADPAALDGLLTLFARVTGLAPDAVDADRPLVDVGLDSVMIIQLNRELVRTGADVPSTIFYEQPTLRAVAARLATAPEPTRQAPTAPVALAVPAVVPSPRAEPRPAPSGRPAGTGEPIAVIGLSGHYPGAADLDRFWDNLKAGRDCIREVDRWPLEGFFEPDRDTAVATGRSYGKWGGFLDDFAEFDPRFFGIAPREAYAMDPQERLFVQAAWEVLEDAGYPRTRLAARHGGGVGVFAGVTKVGHARHGVGRLPSGELVVPGLSFASLSARVSFLLDLRGPSLTVDTMCSASLTAIHEACEQLRRGACDAAIAGGVNLYAHPLDYVELCASGMLSPDERCRSFGEGGRGFVPGEGVGCVLLKPLSRAEADGDRVLGVIRGSGVNHGGRTGGYTVPSPPAQADLIRLVLDRAGVSARQVGYVEAHGTGTELGDPIEIAGLTAAFERDTADRGYCAIGSVKSGIGHLEAAAGVAGLTKVLLQLRHRELVPTLHAERTNPNIDFERSPFRLRREAGPWHSDGPRIAAVSSFGAGGSNAHLVVEEYTRPQTGGPAGAAEQVVVLSARTPDQLAASVDRLAAFLDRNPGTDLADLAYTLQVGREAMAERYAIAVSSVEELRAGLRAGRGHRGSAATTGDLLAELTGDDDLRELVAQRWLAAGKPGRFAALWAAGGEVAWARLHHGATRRVVSLPTYPFARDRFWIGDLTGATPTPAEEPEVVRADTSVPDLVRETIARALAMDAAEIEGGAVFADYGLDSILAVRVVHRLNEALTLSLPTSAVFDFPTADRLTAHLLTEHPDAVERAPAPRHSPRPGPGRTEGHGPIAVVGMSGRFAGADSLDRLWAHLAAGDDLVTGPTRFDPADLGACPKGGFLDRIDEFDAMFFGISGTEAAVMDPQQRLLLEESWKALEDAGYAGAAGRERCGVYVGAWAGDYESLLGHDAPAQTLWGNMASVIPSRVSYFLDLNGPAMAVDTSCSSSLVAIELACKDLWSGETAMALAGGVFVQSTPRLYRLAGRAGMLSPTGGCRAFDHRADGFVPGEGVGVVVLKRLADAVADGDHVHGVIRAVGVNQDGATNGITAPSSTSQESLLRDVYGRFGVDAGRIGLVEAHGTGTRLGDPIEFQALTRAFRAHTDKVGYCALGSVKTNIGHTQFAAGIAGVLKVLLAIKHRKIPASLHFEAANEAIPLGGSPFYVSERTHDWEVPDGGPRCGVVSSFGASGTNAHIVVEEAPPVARTAVPGAEHVVVLSARTDDQLAEQKRRLGAHVRADASIDLGDLAHTLAVGRQTFPRRFTCVVRDRDELIQALDGTAPARTGDVPVQARGRRIPLPTYPFARDRHWPANDHRVTLTPDDVLLRDHVVRGRRILPAVAHLDLARRAFGALPVRMSNVTWVRPLDVSDGPVDVRIDLRAADRGGHRFEITADGTTCCEGTIAVSDAPRPAPVDLAGLRSACPEAVSGERVHDALVTMGIDHGPTLRAIRQARVGTGVVVAELVLPSGAQPGPLAPALLDSAIQAAVAAHPTGMRHTAVPFALDRLDLHRPCPARVWAVVRGVDAEPIGRLDIDLVDPDGEVCVRLTGYAQRPLASTGPALFAPVWDVVDTSDATVPAAGDRVLVVGASPLPGTSTWPLPPSASVEETTAALRDLGPVDHLVWSAPETGLEPSDAAGYTAAQENGVVAAFRMVKALLALGYDARPLGITLVTVRALATHATDPVQPAHAGLHGLFGSLGREYGQWSVRRVDLDGTGWPPDLTALPARSPDDSRVRRAGQWLARRWAPCDAPARPVYREGGVYVVIGGAGGLGTAWTRHVVRNHGAHVTWIGRTPHDETIEEKLRSVEGRGTVHYVSADAADPAALRAAVAEVKQRHGVVHGVVQSALVLRDSTFARMDETALRAALAAKVGVTTAMAEVFDGEVLDFAVLLSSMQSFTTAAGQGNYAAGCTFSDAFAHALGRRWDTPVRVMNWGWWGSLGSVTSEYHRERLSRVGLVSIEPPEGFAALDALLGGDQRQLAFVKTDERNALPNFDRDTVVAVHDRTPSRVPGELLRAVDDVPDFVAEVVRWRRDERDPWLARVLSAQLATVDPAAIRPAYAEWSKHNDPVPAEPADEVLRQWDRQCRLWSTDADRAAELRLATAMLKALPDVLTGRTPATDVMFPRGSLELVEGCYRNNRAADLFNHALAHAVTTIVAERLRREPGARLRVLEIGAGTGGTSAGLFAALEPHRENIGTYVYTDLSKAFLNHARAEYGPRVPYLDYRLLDVERPIAGQGITEGDFDLVIAANVLHATRDTRNTLRNAKAALKAGGWLLLNELSAFDLFSHVTFGLLEGWWLSDDRSLRIPGSPALSPDSWRDVLAGEGFPTVVFPLPGALPLGQQIIAAESDGVARQAVVRAGRPEPATTGPVPEPAAKPDLPESDLPESDLVESIRGKAAAVLGIPPERIDTSVPLTDYGMDSILVLRFTNALRADFGDDVSTALLFEVETVDALCAHFARTAGLRWDLGRNQEVMYRDQRHRPESTHYNLPLLFEIHGDLDEAALERAIRAQSRIHPALGAVFEERDGVPQLVVDPDRAPSFDRVAITAPARAAQLAALRELVELPFDLGTGPLVRSHLISLAGQRLLLITAHHTLMDGTSTAIVVRTLKDAYRGLENRPRADYGDFVAWERALLAGPQGHRHRDYWVRELGGPRATLSLPYDRPYDPTRVSRVEVVVTRLSPALAVALADKAKEHRVSVATALFATYVRFLQRASGQDDVTVGMTTAARYEERFQDVVGQFANCLPIRCTVTGDFPELLGSLRHKVASAIEHGGFPLPEIARAVGAREPLVSANFLFQNFAGAELLGNDSPADPGELDLRLFDDLPYAGEYPLAAEVYRDGEGWKVFLKYDADAFDETTARRMAAEWHEIVRSELEG